MCCICRNEIHENELKEMITRASNMKLREVKGLNYWNQVLEKYMEFGENHNTIFSRYIKVYNHS